MELTYFGERAKRKTSCPLSKLFLCITTLLPFIASQHTILTSSHWDWAVVHSQNVSFYTLKNVSRLQDVLIPPPVLPTAINVSGESAPINFNMGTDHGLRDYTSGSRDPTWDSQELGLIASDRARNLLFFLALEKNLTSSSILMFNMTSNSSYVLMQSNSIHIDKLEFREDYLYWNERNIPSNNVKRADRETRANNEGIWRLNTKNEISTWKAALHFPNNHLMDFTIDPASRILYWVQKDYNTTKINAFDGVTNKEIITAGLFNPHALTSDCSYLYWADDLSERDFTVQRALLHPFNNASGERVYTGRDHAIISIAVLSNSTTVWSDKSYVAMWVRRGGVLKRHDISDEDGVIPPPQPRGIISTYCKPPSSQLITNLSGNGSNKPPAHENNLLPALPVPTITQIPEIPLPSEPSNQPQTPPTQTKTVKPSPINTPVPEKSDDLVDAQADQANETSDPLPTDPINPEIPQRKYVPPSIKLPNPLPPQSIPLSTEGELGGIVIQDSEYMKGRYDVGDASITNNHNVVNNLPIQWCSRENTVTCYNGGSCIQIDSVKICLCPTGFGGPKCQDEIRDGRRDEDAPSTNDIAYPILCSVLSVSVVILSIVSTYLYLRVRELGKKPRIRRRLIVSRAPDSERSSVCEMVDIENCCNMNECETPCYERASSSSSYTSRTKLVPLRGSDSKKEDCQRLVDS